MPVPYQGGFQTLESLGHVFNAMVKIPSSHDGCMGLTSGSASDVSSSECLPWRAAGDGSKYLGRSTPRETHVQFWDPDFGLA